MHCPPTHSWPKLHVIPVHEVCWLQLPMQQFSVSPETLYSPRQVFASLHIVPPSSKHVLSVHLPCTHFCVSGQLTFPHRSNALHAVRQHDGSSSDSCAASVHPV